MPKRIFILLFTSLFFFTAHAGELEGVFAVKLGKDTLVLINSSYGNFTAKERADVFQQKLDIICGKESFNKDSVHIVPQTNQVQLFYGTNWLTTLVQNDTLVNKKQIMPLAIEIKSKMAYSPVKVFTSNVQRFFKQSALVLGIVLLSVLIYYLVRKLYYVFVGKLEKNHERIFRIIRYRSVELLSKERQMSLAILIARFGRFLLTIILIYLAVPTVFQFFPETNELASRLFGYILQPISSIIAGVITFLPKLVTIAIIIVVANFILRFVKYLSVEVRDDRLHIPGFYAEWAMPTYNIIRFVVFAITFVFIFPFLPGSESPILIGALAFLGLLTAMGSTHAVANFVAGLVATFMRPFKIGDRVKVGETSGEVVDKTLLITRIKTKNNEVVTIPNSELIRDHTINYSATEMELGLVIYTYIKVPIEYNWRDVEDKLITAASKAKGILENPKPFVLKREIVEGHVRYQINAYSQASIKLARVKSNLIQSILDEFAEAKIPLK